MSLRKSVMPADSAWWMLNVMFTFAAAVMLIQATRDSARWYAWLFTMLALVVIGALVEFHWSGVAYTLAAYHFCERRTLAGGGDLDRKCGRTVDRQRQRMGTGRRAADSHCIAAAHAHVRAATQVGFLYFLSRSPGVVVAAEARAPVHVIEHVLSATPTR